MSLVLSLALYFVIWWTVLFAVLPLGVTSQFEQGEVVPGSEGAAPHKPMLLRKIVITTLIAAVVFGLLDLVVTKHLISLETLPIGPSFEGHRSVGQ
jgi:predicted secreted protein